MARRRFLSRGIIRHLPDGRSEYHTLCIVELETEGNDFPYEGNNPRLIPFDKEIEGTLYIDKPLTLRPIKHLSDCNDYIWRLEISR